MRWKKRVDNFGTDLLRQLVKLLKKHNLPGSLAGDYSLYESIKIELKKMSKVKGRI